MHPGFWALSVAAACAYASMAVEAVRVSRQDSQDANMLGRADRDTSSRRTMADSSPLCESAPFPAGILGLSCRLHGGRGFQSHTR